MLGKAVRLVLGGVDIGDQEQGIGPRAMPTGA